MLKNRLSAVSCEYLEISSYSLFYDIDSEWMSPGQKNHMFIKYVL